MCLTRSEYIAILNSFLMLSLRNYIASFRAITFMCPFRDEKHHTFNERLINTEDRREVGVGEKFPTEVLGTEVNSDSRGKSSLPDLTLLARKI